MRVLFAILLLTALASRSARADEQRCFNGQGTTKQQIGEFQVEVSPEPGRDPALPCQAIVRSADGKTVFHTTSWGTRIVPITGKSVSGGGEPDAVFEGFSGGAHCCWTYWIVSLGKKPGLLREIYNNVGMGFDDWDHDGKIEIYGLDGAFDYFDGLCHACSPFPLVVFRLSGTELRRVDEEFWPRYEKEISEAQADLDSNCAELFHQGRLRPESKDSACDFTATKLTVLRIVLAYLYGGREQDAWTQLARYWPPQDLDRIRSLILKTARGSFLGDTSGPKFAK